MSNKLLEIEIYKLKGIACVLEDLGYEWTAEEVLSIAHNLEIEISESPDIAEFPENFE